MNAKFGSDGWLNLLGLAYHPLDSPGFAWRTKNSLWGQLNLYSSESCMSTRKK